MVGKTEKRNNKSRPKKSKDSSSKSIKSKTKSLSVNEWRRASAELASMPPKLRLAQLYELLAHASGAIEAEIIKVIVATEDELNEPEVVETASAHGDLYQTVAVVEGNTGALEALVADAPKEQDIATRLYSTEPVTYNTYSRYPRADEDITSVEKLTDTERLIKEQTSEYKASLRIIGEES